MSQTNQCPVCGKMFHKSPSQIKRTCSRSCAAVLRVNGETRTCTICGKKFYLNKARLKTNAGLYCSNKCNGMALRSKQAVTCSWCKQTFERPPHVVSTNKHHFCNRTCKHEWNARYGTKKGKYTFSMKQKREWLAASCKVCGATENLELDHIIPRFVGGKNARDNAQTLCKKCNRDKYWNVDRGLFGQIDTRILGILKS